MTIAHAFLGHLRYWLFNHSSLISPYPFPLRCLAHLSTRRKQQRALSLTRKLSSELFLSPDDLTDRKCITPSTQLAAHLSFVLLSVRKQLKVRPGFTPQEDVKRFRGTRQAQMDANALPKGHILGWVAPSSASQPAKPLSKSAKKNAKRKEKREEKRANATADQPVPDNWEDDDEDDAEPKASGSDATPAPADAPKTGATSPEQTTDKPDKANATNVVSSKAIQKLAADLEKLNTK